MIYLAIGLAVLFAGLLAGYDGGHAVANKSLSQNAGDSEKLIEYRGQLFTVKSVKQLG